jgi:holo-[acyl-carrier protein] synthase
MRVVGLGLDVVDMDRFLPADAKEAALFLARCFSPSELAGVGDGPHRSSRLAARFAAKEAVLKALGIGWGDGIAFTDIEIASASSGAPEVRLYGHCQAHSESLGITRWLVSLTHTRSVAAASIVALDESE